MAKLPLYLSAFIIIGGAMLLAVGGLLFARRVLRIPRDDSDHDVASVFYASVGATYGVLLAFMVVVVWQRFSDTDQAVTAEAADLVVVFRDTQTFPDPLRQQAQDALRAYANEVMTVEWRTHVGAGPHRAPDPLNPVWAVYRQLQPTNSVQEAQYSGAADRLHELEHQRHVRHLSGETTLPPLVWPVLIVGAVILIGLSYFFRPRDLRSQAFMTATLAGLIGTVLFLILSLNQPFTGRQHISREPFRHALQQFNALNAGDAGP